MRGRVEHVLSEVKQVLVWPERLSVWPRQVLVSAKQLLLGLEFVLVLSLAAGCERPRACYHPVPNQAASNQAASNQAGWKQVTLPRAAPHLAAPLEIDQFRSGEPAIVWDAWRNGWETHDLGTAYYRFDDLEASEVLEVRFDARLGGAAVEVRGNRDDADYPLMPRGRLHEGLLRLPLEPHTRSATVVVHHHLRAAPEVSARGGVREHDSAAPGFLYYLDPGAGALQLCETPSREPGLRASVAGAPATPMALRPTPLTRLLH